MILHNGLKGTVKNKNSTEKNNIKILYPKECPHNRVNKIITKYIYKLKLNRNFILYGE